MIRYNRDVDDDDDRDMDDIEMSDDSSSEKVAFNRKPTETVTEVLAFGSDDNDDDDDDDVDENQQESMDYDEDIPNSRAWGKKKKAYYFSEYIDTDYATLTEKDEKQAKIEEEEAKIIQKRIAKELDDVDFSLTPIAEEKTESKQDTTNVIKTDISKLSKRQKLELLEKESPEFLVLLQDIKDQLTEIKSTLTPYLKMMKTDNYSDNAVFQFMQKKYQTALHYSINIMFYLTLKSKRLFFNSHPVIKRLAQYRQLLNQMNSIQEQVLENSEKLLERSKNEKSKTFETEDKFVTLNDNLNDDLSEKEKSDTEIAEAVTENNFENNNERRMITYQIAKNKGLTPHRSKEQRNPRVKHRNKYRKAMIRRKGAVREVRRELKRYGGEMSGIKTGVKKSVSLK
ncbi:something about silencing protein 10 [Leptopilina heterotoma]|uniref:something about silencing protein 10 n=1 Tax=Leptopilina heterotoma TaxID=63436 RepID=UPI001CAA006D|nr:something about silencing protein 10 [Leptopilina heterotoma]